jgi:hypothetical protein
MFSLNSSRGTTSVSIPKDRCPVCGDIDLNHTHELSAGFIVEKEKQLKGFSAPPLRHYHESWWKVEGESIWLLAGKDPNYQLGWYFNDETAAMHGPYADRATAEIMLKKYCEECL